MSKAEWFRVGLFVFGLAIMCWHRAPTWAYGLLLAIMAESLMQSWKLEHRLADPTPEETDGT